MASGWGIEDPDPTCHAGSSAGVLAYGAAKPLSMASGCCAENVPEERECRDPGPRERVGVRAGGSGQEGLRLPWAGSTAGFSPGRRGVSRPWMLHWVG